MNTTKFELTPEEIKAHGYGWMQNYDYEIKELLQAQIAKVISLLEPSQDRTEIVATARKEIGQWLSHQESTIKNYHNARMTETWRVVNGWHLAALLASKDPSDAKVWHWPMPAHEIPDGYHM